MTENDVLTAALTIVVRGRPAPQGSKRHVGNGVMIEMSKHVHPWRDAVRTEAAIAARDARLPTFNGPLWVDMVFTTVRPRSHYRTGANSALLRDAAPLRPTSAPDLSKLARATEDALKDCGVIRDDALIVEYRRLAKVYAGEDVDALDTPGAIIRLYTGDPHP